MLQDNIVDQLLDYFEVVLRHCGEQVIVAYNAKVQLCSKLIYVCNESCCLNGAMTRLKFFLALLYCLLQKHFSNYCHILLRMHVQIVLSFSFDFRESLVKFCKSESDIT